MKTSLIRFGIFAQGLFSFMLLMSTPSLADVNTSSSSSRLQEKCLLSIENAAIRLSSIDDAIVVPGEIHQIASSAEKSETTFLVAIRSQRYFELHDLAKLTVGLTKQDYCRVLNASLAEPAVPACALFAVDEALEYATSHGMIDPVLVTINHDTSPEHIRFSGNLKLENYWMKMAPLDPVSVDDFKVIHVTVESAGRICTSKVASY